MTHFRHRYPPVHIERKRAVQLQKFAPQKLDLTNFLIKLLIRLGRKYYFNFTCRKRGLFVGSVAIYWRLKIGPKLLSSLVSFFTVSQLSVTGDTPTVTAVCGFRLAGRVTTDTWMDSMTLCSVTFIVLNLRDEFRQHYSQILLLCAL